jgi:hypothetical protein
MIVFQNSLLTSSDKVPDHAGSVGFLNLEQLEPYPRILMSAHMLCAACLSVDLSSRTRIRNHQQNNKTKPTRSDAHGAAQPHTRTLPALHSHIRAPYRPYGVVGCHNGRRAGSLVQKRGGSTSSKGSAFTTAVRFLGGTLRAGRHELLAVIPLTARARGGEFGGGVARRGRAWRGSALLCAPPPPLAFYFSMYTFGR